MNSVELLNVCLCENPVVVNEAKVNNPWASSMILLTQH